MCTLIAIHRLLEGRPLVVAANRDEYLDRPAEGPAIRETRAGRILAPLDVRAGGTWLGLSDRGVFAALTNLRTESPDPNARSRGEVVLDALAEGSAEGAAEAVTERMRLELERGEATNPFNLLIADERTAWVVTRRAAAGGGTTKTGQMDAAEGAIERRELEPGVHVVGNVDAHGPPNPKVSRVLAEAMAVGNAGAGGAQNDILEGLGELCRHHGDATDPLSDTCVHLNGTHGDDRGERPVYGTRSSMLLELETGFKAGRLLHADGAPCVTSYEDLSSLIRDLGRRPASVGQGALMRTAG